MNELTTCEIKILTHLSNGPIRSPFWSVEEQDALPNLFQSSFIHHHGVTYSITDAGRKVLLMNIGISTNRCYNCKKKMGTQLTHGLFVVFAEERRWYCCTNCIGPGVIRRLAQANNDFIIQKEATATLEVINRVMTEWQACKENKLSNEPQPMSDLLRFLAAFELDLEKELAKAKRDYAQNVPSNNYSKGLNWGHVHGLTVVTALWQACREAIAKIGGQS